ncbi:hypothetical protein HPB50_018653 [Hyalomma asiaticum]|uniref:Uncharacterized protein n=1 Tax=Hyalomma asiaticum TaxID=266040 RepID=A0ACB7SFA9_HYAAI|nr:hypothetical protein HPB50_018653 [Hyalomma asiaticum]
MEDLYFIAPIAAGQLFLHSSFKRRVASLRLHASTLRARRPLASEVSSTILSARNEKDLRRRRCDAGWRRPDHTEEENSVMDGVRTHSQSRHHFWMVVGHKQNEWRSSSSSGRKQTAATTSPSTKTPTADFELDDARR